MTRRTIAAALLAAATLPLAACAGGPGMDVGYGGGPYAYDGYYDGYYGPVYDGYWGDDDYFYYRHGAGDHAYVRGDRGHFAHQAPDGQHNFQQLHSTVTPSRGMSMPHFHGGGGGGHGAGGGGGHDHH